MTELVPIVPPPGRVKETAKALLALADSPKDVRTGGNGTEFLVPPALAQKYMGQGPEEEAPVRRTRRRKIQEEGD